MKEVDFMFYIYKIVNSINDKIYIGRTDNYEIRFIQHKSCARQKLYNNQMYKDMLNYGFDKFSIEVIEEVDDFETSVQKEQYYINYYKNIQSIYNIVYTKEHKKIKNTTPAEKINEIKYDLEYSQETMRDISKKYKISLKTLTDINVGNSYNEENRKYPIRLGDKDKKFNKEFLNCIMEDLKNGVSYRAIAEKYKISKTTARKINTGESFYNPELSYPIFNRINTKYNNETHKFE